MAFKYRPRSVADWEKRANQSGGDFENIFKDEYNVYAPKDGQNWIRVLPSPDPNSRHYGEDVYVHYRIGADQKAAVLCPRMMADQPCPVCEELTRATRAGADEEELRDLKPTKRVVMWLLDGDDMEKGPQLWAAPWTVDKDMAKAAKDPRSGAIYMIEDPVNGYDVFFDKSGKQRATKYTTFQVAREPSAVDPAFLDYVEENPMLDTLIYRDYDEIKKIFDGGIPFDEKLQPSSRRRPSPEGRPAAATAEPAAPQRGFTRPAAARPAMRPAVEEVPDRTVARPPRRMPTPETDEESLAADGEHIRNDPMARRRPAAPVAEPAYEEPAPPSRPAPREYPETPVAGADRATGLRARFGKK